MATKTPAELFRERYSAALRALEDRIQFTAVLPVPNLIDVVRETVKAAGLDPDFEQTIEELVAHGIAYTTKVANDRAKGWPSLLERIRFMNRDDLMRFWAEVHNSPVRTARALFPEKPKGYVAMAKLLGAYASNKAAFMYCESQADANGIAVYSNICAQILDKLPETVRQALRLAETPNLDDIGVSEALYYATAYTEHTSALASRMFPERPAGGGVSSFNAVKQLGAYATYKAQAVQKRLAGEINAAVELEAKCDGIYQGLPTWARW